MDAGWEAIWEKYNLGAHDFAVAPFAINNFQINEATKHLARVSDREVRILCKQDTRESRPRVFRENGLFLLPVTNGSYVILQGEGYIDIPPITEAPQVYRSKLDFPLQTSLAGNSEMQHLDFAYATSLVRSFLEDLSLVLTIRGRKYTPLFSFRAAGHAVNVQSVQTEVDAGYEGRNQVVLMEAKSGSATNTIIRQLFYPLRQWTQHTSKPIQTLFFGRTTKGVYNLWHFRFTDPEDYNSIEMVRAEAFVYEQEQ